MNGARRDMEHDPCAKGAIHEIGECHTAPLNQISCLLWKTKIAVTQADL
jgi:hypothetical protein